MLPIQKHIREIKDALIKKRCAVVQAPPGAGKTTCVPIELMEEPWLEGKKIILLEPRRLAAVSCAGHMAGMLNEKVGESIGYRIRLDKKVTSRTKIEVVTEGIFTRKIQNDPSLEDTGLVIFDEFHERNVHSDLGLALCLDTFEALRDDLRILVMSATMDSKAVSDLIGSAPVIISRGKMYPVETVYAEASDSRGPNDNALYRHGLNAVKDALRTQAGDILVFLPGIREIRSVESQLKNLNFEQVSIHPLYGNLSPKDQAAVIALSPPGKRKIVLATAIAETSITIKGIDTVIDFGCMRLPRFSWKSGMSRLVTLPVSRASADQRRGRAGRTGPGKCYRLWTTYEHGLLKDFSPPEIASADMTAVVLELAAWGVTDPSELKWLDLPDSSSYSRARSLLFFLGAVDESGRITPHGKMMAGFGLHPRFSHMIIKGCEIGLGALACRVAAFLMERDFIRFEPGYADPDIRLRLEWIEAFEKGKKLFQKDALIYKGIIRRILESEKKIRSDFKVRPGRIDIQSSGRLLAHAYPDRVAGKRDSSRDTFLTASGKGIRFASPCGLSLNPFIVALHLDGDPKNAKVFLGAPYSYEALEKDFGDRFETEEKVLLDKKSGTIQSMKETRFDKLPVTTKKLRQADPDKACRVLIEYILSIGLSVLPWTRKLNFLRDRMRFLSDNGHVRDLPDVSEEGLKKNIETWLAPFLSAIFSLKQLGKMDLEAAFLSMLTWEQQKTIEAYAPTHLIVPSGSKRPLVYRQGKMILDSPVLEVRLQEMFGLLDTPKIAGGRAAVTISLLSPAGRPVQVTKDLKSFWSNTYTEVKKDLAGRYPKHYWPDDPFNALPTSRVRPRKK